MRGQWPTACRAMSIPPPSSLCYSHLRRARRRAPARQCTAVTGARGCRRSSSSIRRVSGHCRRVSSSVVERHVAHVVRDWFHAAARGEEESQAPGRVCCCRYSSASTKKTKRPWFCQNNGSRRISVENIYKGVLWCDGRWSHKNQASKKVTKLLFKWKHHEVVFLTAMHTRHKKGSRTWHSETKRANKGC